MVKKEKIIIAKIPNCKPSKREKSIEICSCACEAIEHFAIA